MCNIDATADDVGLMIVAHPPRSFHISLLLLLLIVTHGEMTRHHSVSSPFLFDIAEVFSSGHRWYLLLSRSLVPTLRTTLSLHFTAARCCCCAVAVATNRIKNNLFFFSPSAAVCISFRMRGAITNGEIDIPFFYCI